MPLIRIAWGLGIVVLVVACAAPVKRQTQVRQQPSPIHCATAQGDIRLLQNEKAHVLQQIAMGVTAIAPAGLVMGALTGTEQTPWQVPSGDYNRMIDQRIAEIRTTCRLP